MPVTLSENPIDVIFQHFEDVTKNPEEYLSAQPKKSIEIKKLLNSVYGLTYENDVWSQKNVEILPELYLDGLDEEQIWQQLELRNEAILPVIIEKVSKQLSVKDSKFEISIQAPNGTSANNGYEEDDEEIEDDEIIDEEMEDDDSNEEENEDSENLDTDDDEMNPGASLMKKVKIIPSVVDDKFFKLSEMEAFLNAEDEKENRKQRGDVKEDDIDYFNGDFSDEEEENAVYNQFFVDDGNQKTKGKKKKLQFEEGSDIDVNDDEVEEEFEEDNDEEESVQGEEDDDDHEDNDDDDDDDDEDDDKEKKIEKGYVQDDESNDSEEENNKPKSSFELRQERLKERIKEYEEEVLGEKPWQLKGEISSTARPQNSLLEEILEFESTTRPAPIITEETTLRLEDIIKQRIKDQAWDDVERKVKPVHTPQEFRKQLVLDQEKSKESLAQVYEKEYQSEIEKLNPDNANADEEEPKAHKQIKEIMSSLFVKLDALSNFHFTPKPIAPEAKIITNTPAVQMEEVAPLAVSDAKLLAPEEVRARAKGDIMGKTERSRTDKNRERRKKKLKQRAIHNALEKKDLQKQKMGIQLSKKEEQAKLLKSVTKNRNVQKLNVSTNETFKSSKSFFSQLQDKSTTAKRPNKTEPDKTTLSAKKLKL